MHAAHQQTGSMDSVSRLSDEDLVATMHRLLRQERKVSAALLLHLGEVDARGLYRQQAYSSMFDYCVQALHLSESEAYLRIRAARLGRQFPRVLRMLADGELHLSAVKLLAPVLTDDNCEKLLSAARLKSKRDVELLLAQRCPLPDVPSVIRKLPQQALVPERAVESQTALLAIASSESAKPCEPAVQLPRLETQREPVPCAPLGPTARPVSALSPLGQDRYKVQFSASQQFHDKLRQAQNLLRHELPGGDLAAVLERALDVLIAERMKKRFGQGARPRARRVAPRADSRHIPRAVSRAVLARDGARCSYVSTGGKRCEQRGWLELHHEQPFGRGGPATLSNIRVLCRAHNQLLAERDYGRDFVQHRIERSRLIPDPEHHP